MGNINQNNLSEGRKERIRDKIILGAKNYKQYLCDKTFRILCEDGTEKEVRFFGADFQHLTGVKSDLNDERFFDNCRLGTIDKGNILTNQKYNWSTLKRKSDRIVNIHGLLYENNDKTLLLEEFEAKSCVFPVAIKNNEMDTCVGFTSDINKARSLRNAISASKCKDEKKIVFIAAKKNGEEKFTELVYSAENINPDEKLEVLNNSL